VVTVVCQIKTFTQAMLVVHVENIVIREFFSVGKKQGIFSPVAAAALIAADDTTAKGTLVVHRA